MLALFATPASILSDFDIRGHDESIVNINILYFIGIKMIKQIVDGKVPTIGKMIRMNLMIVITD